MDANPRDVTYRWYINDELVAGNHTTKMVNTKNIFVQKKTFDIFSSTHAQANPSAMYLCMEKNNTEGYGV